MVIIHGFDKVRSKDKSINQRKFQNPNILNPACISQLSGCGEPLKSVQRCPQLCWNPCVICWVFPENLFPLPPAKSKSCPQSKEKWICFIQMIKWKWEMCERWPSLSGSGENESSTRITALSSVHPKHAWVFVLGGLCGIHQGSIIHV
jgi:hypothetical protein